MQQTQRSAVFLRCSRDKLALCDDLHSYTQSFVLFNLLKDEPCPFSGLLPLHPVTCCKGQVLAETASWASVSRVHTLSESDSAFLVQPASRVPKWVRPLGWTPNRSEQVATRGSPLNEVHVGVLLKLAGNNGVSRFCL